MAKRATPKTTKVPAVRTEGHGLHSVGGRELLVDRLYHVPAVHPRQPGEWMNEADKVAWTDPITGYGCIILRSATDGHLSGFVGVDPGHSLHGWRHDALSAAFGIEVHGGLDYSRLCQPGDESRSVCHVTEVISTVVHASGTGRRDDKWWFGFSCDQPYDLKPGNGEKSRMPSASDDALTRPRVYRNEAYLLEQTTNLASQLDAIAKGREPVAPSPPPPPIGLDPDKAREL